MLAALLKEKCRQFQLSSRQVAEKVGVSHATIQRALRGDIVDLDTLIKISAWLKVKPSMLLNSLARSHDVLADQVAVVVERHPRLASAFSRALKVIVDGDVDLHLIDDIAAFAACRLNIEKKPD